MTNGNLFSGKTVEDAIADALRTLGLTQDQVVVDVLSRGSRGLFGIGSEPAQVRVTPKPQAATPAAHSPAAATTSCCPGAGRTARGTACSAHAAGTRRRQTAGSTQAAPPAPVDSTPTTVPTTSDPTEPLRFTETLLPPLDPEDATVAALAAELLAETVRRMGFDATVTANLAWA